MDIKTLSKFHATPTELNKISSTPEDAVIEIKFAATRNRVRRSKAPAFKVHNMRAAYKRGRDIVHIVRTPPNEDVDDCREHELLRAASAKMIKADLIKRGIITALEELWYEEGGNTDYMWGHGFLKHSSFSPGDIIQDYGSKIYYIAKPILRRKGRQAGLGSFLAKEGFEVGKYYNVTELMVALKKFFKVDVYPTFIKHGGYHPALFEIGLLLTKDGKKRLDHPMAKYVPEGKFLMRHI